MRLEEEAEAVVVLFPVAGIAIGADLYGGEVVAIAVAVVVGPVEAAVASAVLGEEVLVVADQAVVGKKYSCKKDQ